MNAVKQIGWRLLFIAGFLPLGLPVILWSACVLMAAAVMWLLRGPGVLDGKDRTDRWLCEHISRALAWPLDRLMRKAGVLRELWTDP